MSTALLAVAGPLLWAPGSLLARAAGVRRGWSLAIGPALGWGLAGTGAVAVPAAGLSWHPWTALGWWAVLVAAVVLLRVLLGVVERLIDRRAGRVGRARGGAAGAGQAQPAAQGSRRGVALAVCGVGAAALLPIELARRSGVSLTSVDQLWDAVWHANLTAFVARTGSVSPTAAPAQLFDAGWRTTTSFYPDALHASAALVVDLTGAGALPCLMAVVAVSYGAVLPAGVAALTWTLTRGSGAGAAAAAVASVLFLAFPTDQWWRGAWAYGVALAGVPMACALVVAGLRGHLTGPRGPGLWASRAARALVPGVLALVGLAALQPAAAVAAGLVLGGWLVGRLLWLRWWVAVPVAVLLALGLTRVPDLVWSLAARVPTLASLAAYDYTTLPYAGPALRQVLGLVTPVDASLGYGAGVQAPQHALEAVLLVSAAVALTRREGVWLVGVLALLVAAATSTVTHVLPDLHVLTLFFYSSAYRLVAVIAIVGAVVIGVALARVVDLGGRLVPGWWRRRVLGAGAAVVVVVGAVAIAGGTLARGEVRMRAGFADRVVGPHQEAVMRALARQPLPAGARVINDSVDGSPWMYALAGVEPMFTHYTAGQVPDDLAHLLRHLDHVDTNVRVQQELRAWRVCYIYTNATLVTAKRQRSKGFDHLGRERSLQLVARSGPAAAYRVDLPGMSCASGKPAARSLSDR